MSRTLLMKIMSVFLFALLLGACAAASPRMVSEESGGFDGSFAEAPVAAEMDVAESKRNAVESSIPQQDVERVIIRTANMSLVVVDPPQSMENIKKLAEQNGGFVVSANLSQRTLDNGVVVPYASVTIRVPAENLDPVIEQIRAESDRLPLSENINSQDVTDDYIDLNSRLRNLEAAEEQLAQIMEETQKTEDVLSVYNELVRVREQIEVIKGQIKYYEQSAALSSVSVELMANEAVQPLTIGGWQPAGVVKSAIQALIVFFKGFVNFLIWLVLFLAPVLLMIGVIFVLPVVLIVRAVRRRRNRHKSTEPKTAEES
jgi:hypothetical protein